MEGEGNWSNRGHYCCLIYGLHSSTLKPALGLKDTYHWISGSTSILQRAPILCIICMDKSIHRYHKTHYYYSVVKVVPHRRDFETTVEPPNKEHFGANSFVPCREVVPISEVLKY